MRSTLLLKEGGDDFDLFVMISSLETYALILSAAKFTCY